MSDISHWIFHSIGIQENTSRFSYIHQEINTNGIISFGRDILFILSIYETGYVKKSRLQTLSYLYFARGRWNMGLQLSPTLVIRDNINTGRWQFAIPSRTSHHNFRALQRFRCICRRDITFEMDIPQSLLLWEILEAILDNRRIDEKLVCWVSYHPRFL